MTTSARAPLNRLLSLEGEVALVTGAAKGIGQAIAERLAEAGASVTLCDVDADGVDVAVRRLREVGLSADSYIADVGSETEVRDLVADCVKRFGPIDVLVNNAGIFPMFTVRGMSSAEMDRVLATNLRGPALLTRDVAEVMIASGKGGRILNVTSIDALHPSMVGLAAYDASKHALWGFTKNTALELAPHGIRVNALAPGGVLTPGVIELTGAAASEGVDPAGGVEDFTAALPLRRLAEPDEIAVVALGMVSALGSYMVGSQVVVDGGALLT
jgi:2-deoxy-D-gluconate 3-dehydrogenase